MWMGIPALHMNLINSMLTVGAITKHSNNTMNSKELHGREIKILVLNPFQHNSSKIHDGLHKRVISIHNVQHLYQPLGCQISVINFILGGLRG